MPTLTNAPRTEDALRGTFGHLNFEAGVAAEGLGVKEVLVALDWPAYFQLLGQPPADGYSANVPLKPTARSRHPV